MRANRTFTLTVVVCLTALLLGMAQSTPPSKHTSKKTAHLPQAQVASATPLGSSAVVQQSAVAEEAASRDGAARSIEKLRLAGESAEIGDSEKNELYDKEMELGKAEESKQVAFFQQNLTPNFMYVAFNGLVLSKNEVLHALSHVQLTGSEIRNVRFRRLDHNVVQLAYDLFVNGDVGGQAIPHQQYATSIWVKEGGNWLLAYHQTTPAHHR